MTIKAWVRSGALLVLLAMMLAGCSNKSEQMSNDDASAADAAAATGEQAADAAVADDAAADSADAPVAADDEPMPGPQPPVPPAPPHPYPAPPSPGNAHTTGAEPHMPEFPSRPPRPTSTFVMTPAMLGTNATLGDVARRLDTALDAVGYSDRKYYGFPGGFALATRLEQIAADGTPKSAPDRWNPGLPARPVGTIMEFLRVLVTAPEGHYRVLVFIVTPQGFETSDKPATEAMADTWIAGGWNLLPDAVANRSAANAKCTVLVYQFRKRGHEQPALANPNGAPTAKQHLEKSGILAALK